MKLDLDRYVPGLVLWISNRLSSSASHLYRSRFGIGVTDWRVLSYFHIHPWSTASTACDLMGIDKAAVSRSASFLGTSGHLESRAVGLRRIQYRLTAQGRELHDAVIVAALAREEALLEGFSPQERPVLLGFLHRMLANVPSLQPQANGTAGNHPLNASASPRRRPAPSARRGAPAVPRDARPR